LFRFACKFANKLAPTVRCRKYKWGTSTRTLWPQTLPLAMSSSISSLHTQSANQFQMWYVPIDPSTQPHAFISLWFQIEVVDENTFECASHSPVRRMTTTELPVKYITVRFVPSLIVWMHFLLTQSHKFQKGSQKWWKLQGPCP
jgi:hypothetical protein